MKSRNILKTLGALVVIIIIAYSFFPAVKPYPETVISHREDINEFMKFDQESPLPDSVKSSFQGLDFFDPNPEFKVRATLEFNPDNSIMRLPTSDGKIREYKKYAFASFELQGSQHRLTLLQPVTGEDRDRLFLPFGDLTNGEATYGGGRYLDLELTTRNKITMDFNLAYNPYCAYNATYSCPLPPAENQISVAIEAGEKNYRDSD